VSIETAYRLFFEGKLDHARSIVKRIIERSPSPKAYFLYALISYREKSVHEALWAVNKATEYDSDFYEAWILKAKILRSLKKYKEALECLDRAFEIQLRNDDYSDYEILVYKAEIYLEMGNKENARRELKKAKEINPDDDEIKRLEISL